jgi:quercetin dioxygenase-like cupin family protein
MTEAAPADEPMEISPDVSRPVAEGSADHFSGNVSVKPLFNPNAVRTFSSAEVTFTPCARTAWHTHPAGQTLIVTTGTGWIQQWRG